MALKDSLELAFGEDGFSIEGAFGDLIGELDTIGVPEIPLDVGSIATVAEGLGDVSVDVLLGAVELVVDGLGATGLEIPLIDDLVRPLQDALDVGRELLAAGDLSWFTELTEADVGVSGTGFEALQHRFENIGDALSGPAVSGAVGLIDAALPESLDIADTVKRVGEWLETVKTLVYGVGGLMGVDGASRELGDGVDLVLSMMSPAELGATVDRLAQWSDRGLGDLLIGIDPDDVGMLDVVVPPIVAMTRDIRAASEALNRGMGFGQATLVGLDVGALEAKLEAATNLLIEEGMSDIRTLSEQLVAWIGPLLDVDLPEAMDSTDAFWALLGDHLGVVASGIEQLDPNRLTGALSDGLGQGLAVITAVGDAAEEVAVIARSSIDGLDGLLDAVDLSPVTEAIAGFLAPIEDVIAAISQVVGDAEEAIGEASEQVVAAIEAARAALNAAVSTISTSFGRVQSLVAAINIEAVQRAIEDGIAPIADALLSAQVKPFFDAADEAIDKTADVVGAIPLDLLPADAKSELAEAVQPVKAIDFQADVVDVLVPRMETIAGTLDEDVLAEIEVAYQAVIAFLAEIDPAAPIADLEATTFDPFLDALRAIDPDELLRPLEEGLEPITEAIGAIEIGDQLFAPIESTLDEIESQLLLLSPADLVAPLQEDIDQVRSEVETMLHLDEIDRWLDTAEQLISGPLDRLDPRSLAAALDRAYDAVVGNLAAGPSGLGFAGSIVVTMLQGTGTTLRTDSLDNSLDWINGKIGSVEVQGRIRTAADGLAILHDAVAATDLGALIADLQPEWTEINEAVRALPENSVVRAAIELEVTGAEPQALLGPFVEPQRDYGAALDEAAASLDRLARSERTMVDSTAAAIREATSPLNAVTDWVRSLLARFGIDSSGLSIREMLGALLATFRPSDVLDPLISAVETVIANLRAVAADGLLAPVRDVVADLRAALNAIDIGFLITELDEVFASLTAKLDQLRPSVALGPAVADLEALQATLASFDPLAPVRIAVDAIGVAIDAGAETLRPTILFAPVTTLYADLVRLAGGLDVRAMLEPLIVAIDGISGDLGEGLDSLSGSIGRLQDALPDPESLTSSGSFSAGVG